MEDKFLYLQTHPFFGIFLTLLFYIVGMKIHQRWKSPFTMPLIIAIVSIILVLVGTKLPYKSYLEGGKYVSVWITPATVALAIKMEKYYPTLKANIKSILVGIGLGVLMHTILVLILVKVFGLSGKFFATLYPKSVTTAIAMGVSESMGGNVSLTLGLVVFTGIVGAALAPLVFKVFGINHGVAQGIALGTSAHAVGTTKAIEYGELQGAMSGLAITVTGIITVILAPLARLILEMLF